MPERRYLTLFLSIVLYVLSMCFVFFFVEIEEYLNKYGFLTFVMGGLFQFIVSISFTLLIFLTWLANPILWLAWIHIKRPKRSLYLSLVSSTLSFSFIFWSYDDKVLGLGYFLWLASSLVVLFGCLSMLKIVKV